MVSESRRGRVGTVLPAVPVDLVLALVTLAAGVAVVLGFPSLPSAVRAGASLPLLFFLPGYGLVAALFPRGTDGRSSAADDATPATPIDEGSISRGRPPTTPERLALATGLSVAILPIVGVALGETAGIEPVTVLAAISALVTGGVLVGGIRRLRLPPTDRYRFPLGRWLSTASGGITDARTPALAGARLMVGLLVVASLAGVGYVVVAGGSPAGYTDFVLVTESDDGEYVAGDYPETLAVGEPTALAARIVNHEGRSTEYTVVVQIQSVPASNGSERVTDRLELARESRILSDGDEWLFDRRVRPPEPGTDRRLVYLLYRGDPPETPTRTSADRSAHVWVDVVDGDG